MTADIVVPDPDPDPDAKAAIFSDRGSISSVAGEFVAFDADSYGCPEAHLVSTARRAPG